MNEVKVNDEINISDMIYEIRGKQVMLDSDLARLYGCKNGTKTINQAVSRHLDRFPHDFYFQINNEEYQSVLRSQVGTANRQMSRTLPYVFTEEGVAMLSAVLRTDVASVVSIRIMRAFVAMRHYIGNNEFRLSNVESKLLEHDNEIKLIQESFKKFDEKKIVNEIYYKGQIYDAYSRIIDILSEARTEIIIIDRYVDKMVLDMIRNLKIEVILITKENAKLSKLDISKYNDEYGNLKVIYSDDYHDRYFILDRKIVYHCGTSINNAGSRLFSINMLTDKFVINNLVDNVLNIINIKNN